MFRNGFANDGIRFMIWRQVLAVDGLYVGLPDIAILGLVFSIVLDEIGRRLISLEVQRLTGGSNVDCSAYRARQFRQGRTARYGLLARPPRAPALSCPS